MVSLVPLIAALACLGLSYPVQGPIVSGFAPVGRYAGHWGVDFSAPAGTQVTASASGRVSFSGNVVGNSTVTVEHGGGLRTSYSYLATRIVFAGQHVGRGAVVGTAGTSHGGLHFSVRVGSR